MTEHYVAKVEDTKTMKRDVVVIPTTPHVPVSYPPVAHDFRATDIATVRGQRDFLNVEILSSNARQATLANEASHLNLATAQLNALPIF